MSDDEKKTLHIQTVTLTFAANDENIRNLDALNERIKKFVQQDIVEENQEHSLFDGVTLVADSRHDDMVGTLDEFAELADAIANYDEFGSVESDDGLRLPPPPQGKEYLN